MTAIDLPVLAETVAAQVAGDLSFDTSALTPRLSAVGIVSIRYHGEHACVCGVHHCGQEFDHEYAYRSAETSWRESRAVRIRCRACGGPDRFEAPNADRPVCFEIVRVDPSAVTR